MVIFIRFALDSSVIFSCAIFFCIFCIFFCICWVCFIRLFRSFLLNIGFFFNYVKDDERKLCLRLNGADIFFI